VKLSRYNVVARSESGEVVYNGVSGAVVAIAETEFDHLRGFLAGDGVEPPHGLLERLVRGRMLIADDCDELDLLRRRYEATRHQSDRFALTIVTSLGCNFDCPYCFEAKHPSLLKPGVEEAILAVVDEKLLVSSELAVTWFGGEPLVGKRSMFALSDAFIARCDAAGAAYEASMTTNGYLLDASTCVELAGRRVREVDVSLDGPPEVHDRRRPLANGGATFARILENLHHAVDHFDVRVRVNVDHDNAEHLDELLRILAAEGLGGRLTVYLGQVVAVDDGVPAPSARYGPGPCLTNREFAALRVEFATLATTLGFATHTLPRPVGTPCTAVRANELIVGSRGELYKCPLSIGNPGEVTGSILDVHDPNGRLRKWLSYDPFADAECRECVALPVCMGGCAHHAMDAKLYSNRCDSFRWTYQEQVAAYAAAKSGA
jgi:uncharacterized protein